ncbi:hypothetical protein A3I56_01190 [Candidatus Roizmanbacteria bacterium RIFCSPLOWO2_02_FULL_43_10]|uniref:Uncharacterized protein n=2 Tax=Candidatus Roizmaniibacteriota TaxID=1752723 RepID=A0A1F7JX60_9BACT|nr:MAG: hypothetical protein A3D08_00675 [Candidatus Roizmanbacteria bacterium RIFCSPHIGHO2_02_FULL_43_11]OGK60191.1 MAG: hypothetical protein A3I56_01190 [Candidatus Roizmanbacteria bacterium RIFCSPLOWO2_02_FULL_43_10]
MDTIEPDYQVDPKLVANHVSKKLVLFYIVFAGIILITLIFLGIKLIRLSSPTPTQTDPLPTQGQVQKSRTPEQEMCHQKAQQMVSNDFDDNPNFPPETLLRFKRDWYATYFKQCMHDQRYTVDGVAIPPSTLQDNQTTMRYVNHYFKFQFSVPVGTSITSDNSLDVVSNPTRHVVRLTTPYGEIMVDTFADGKLYRSFDALVSDHSNFSAGPAEVTKKEIMNSDSGVKLLYTVESTGIKGVTFFIQNNYVVELVVNFSFPQDQFMQVIRSIEIGR